jgi:hypothetical protein
MKKMLMIVSLFLTACLSSSVWADTPSSTMNDPTVNSKTATSPSMNGAPTTPAMPPGSQMMTGPERATWGGGQGGKGGYHPCKHIEETCAAAGYVRGGAKSGKGLMENCMMPIMRGQGVAGVSAINPQEVAACKQKREQHGRGMGGGMHGMQNGGGMQNGPGMQNMQNGPSMQQRPPMQSPPDTQSAPTSAPSTSN